MSKWTIYDRNGKVLHESVTNYDGNGKVVEQDTLEYSGKWMGDCFVTVSFKSAYPIDFQIGDYIIYRGERFTINYDPTVVKKSSRGTYGEGFTYDSVKFNALSNELTDAKFHDWVLSDNKIHYSSLPNFSFYAKDMNDLADRLQACMDRWCKDNGFAKENYWIFYTPGSGEDTNPYDRTIQRAKDISTDETFLSNILKRWKEIYGDTGTQTERGEERLDRTVSIDNQTVWQGMALFKSQFGLNFIVRGREVIVGAAGVFASHIFKYGKDNGLYEVDKQAGTDQKVVTRLHAYGSSDNLPTRYYAELDMKVVGHVEDVYWQANHDITASTGKDYGWKTDYLTEFSLDIPYKPTMFNNPTYEDGINESKYEEPFGYFVRVSIEGGPTLNACVHSNSYGKDDTAKARACVEVRYNANGSTVKAFEWQNTDNDAFKKFSDLVAKGKKIFFESGVDKDKAPVEAQDYTGTKLPDNMAVMNLMLPGFPKYALSELCGSTYDEASDTTSYSIKNPYTNTTTVFHTEPGKHVVKYSSDQYDPYIVSQNAEALGYRDDDIFCTEENDDNGLKKVYPSVEEVKESEAGVSSSDEYINTVVSADVVEDNGVFPNKETTKIPGFTITIKNLGFDLRAAISAAGGDSCKISMKDGFCGGREFDVPSVEHNADGTWTLHCKRAQDSSLDIWFPYSYDKSIGNAPGASTNAYQVCKGDHYVLLGISLDETNYVWAASVKLLAKAIHWLCKNDYSRYTYSPKIDEIYMARQDEEAKASGGKTKSLHDTLKEGDLLWFQDDDLRLDGKVYIDQLVIKENGNNGIPTYDVTLRNEVLVGTIQRIQNKVDSIANDIRSGNVGGGVSPSGVENIVNAIGEKKYLSKTHDDSTPHKLTMGAAEVKGDATIKGDAIIGKDGFAGGLTGFGTRLGKDGMIEADGLSLRRFLEVPELRYNRVEVYVGNQWRAPGAGIIESVTPDTNSDGTEAATGEIKLKLEEGEIGKVAVDDICMGIFHDHVAGSNATEDSDDGKGGFKFSGFYTCYFKVTSITETAHNSAFKYELRKYADGSYSRHPSVAMHFVCYGNFTNPSRQTCRYSTLTYERYLAGVDRWTFGKGNIRAQFGDLSNLSMFGLNMSGYSAYINNVYLDGHLVQLGDGGIDGITPYTYSVDNIADTVPVDAAGNLKQELVATQADGSKEWLLHCSITVRKGQELLTCTETGGDMTGKYALTMVCDGCTAHFDHSTLLVDTVDYRKRKTASVEVTMDCEGRTALTMQFTIKIVADGKRGSDGTQHGYDHAYAISSKATTASATTAPSDVETWSASPMATTDKKPYLWLRETPWSQEAGGEKLISAAGTTYMRLTGNKGDDGVPGRDGKDGNSWRMRGRAEAWYRTQSDFNADTRTWENGQVALIDKSGDSYHFAQMLQGKTALRDGVWVGVSSDEGDAYTIGSHIYMAVEDRWLDLGEFAGERGPQGEPGSNGRTVRIYRTMEVGRKYFAGDEVTADGFCYLDYYAESNPNAASGWDMFRCRKTYTHKADSKREENWTQVGVNANDAFFQTLIAKNARIDFLEGTSIAVSDKSGKQYAGIGGNVPLWVGERHDYPGVTGDNYSAYTFTVSKDGTLYSKNAYIEGNVTATTGKIAGFNINGDTLEGRNDFRKSVVTLSPGKIDLTTEADGHNGYIRRKFVADSASSNIVAAIGYKIASAQSPHTYFAALQLKAEGGAEVALDILSGVLRGVRLETATVENSCTIMPSDDATNQTGMVARGILYVRTGALVMIGDSNGTDTTITLPKNPPDGSNYTFMGLTGRNYHLLPGTSGQTVHSVNDGKEWAEITVKAGCMAFLVAKGGKWYCRIFY